MKVQLKDKMGVRSDMKDVSVFDGCIWLRPECIKMVWIY